ncbi:MAG: hypothetical protein HOM21_03105, partial [Halobacteriovoraceae bacterium]|nr:hypothetical protein [Halobacteriovoraceae bacterium]
SLKKVVDLTKRNKSPEDMLLLTSFANTLCQQPEKPDDAQLKCLSNFILGRHLLIGNNGIFGDTDVANDAKKQEEYLKLVQSVCINGDYANRPGDRCISDNYKKYGFQPKYFFNCKNQLEGVIFFVENALKGIDEIQELPPCPNRE